MRKLPIAFALSLLLLLAQQGAVLHGVAHLANEVAAIVAMQAGVQADKACELCVAFSQVANPASGSASLPRFLPSACAAGAACIRFAAVLDQPSPRNRGPPLPI